MGFTWAYFIRHNATVLYQTLPQEERSPSNSNTGTEELSKSTCWSDSSYSPGDNTQTYFVEWGEAVTVCALHCHTKLKNQYSTGGRCVMVPDVYSKSKNTASRRRAQERGLEKKYRSRGSSNDYPREQTRPSKRWRN